MITKKLRGKATGIVKRQKNKANIKQASDEYVIEPLRDKPEEKDDEQNKNCDCEQK